MYLIIFSYLKISEDFFCYVMVVWDVIIFVLYVGGGVIYFIDKESCKWNKIRIDNMWYVKCVFFCLYIEYIKLEGKSKSIVYI